jgi:F-type H+-transporting ATPase subunit b
MGELISTFHIDIKMIIAQFINFAIVLFVLYKFAYGPMTKLMDERAEKIDKGIKDSEEAHKKLTEITEKEKEVLVEARKQAQEIVSKAEAVAIKNKEEIVVEAKAQAEKILADSAKKIEQEKNQMMQDVKAQVAQLIVSATGKIIDSKIDAEKDKELINKSLQN